MQQMLLNETTAARRRIPMFFFDDDSADAYAPKTGLTFAAGELKVSKNGAAEANALGTVTELAGGGYYYEATAAEMDTLGFLQVRPVKTDVYGAPVVVQVIALNLYDAAAGGMSRIDASISSRLAGSSYENTDAFLDKADAIEAGLTPRQAIRGLCAALFGKVSGARTGTETFRNAVADSQARLTVTSDAQGNRTNVVTSL
jgi:hypothetical protein